MLVHVTGRAPACTAANGAVRFVSAESVLRVARVCVRECVCVLCVARLFLSVCVSMCGCERVCVCAPQLAPYWAEKGVKVIALSCDPVDSHAGWVADIEAYNGVKVNYPIIADPTR